MKTYLLTEKDVERLREEFCISMMQSEILDEMIRGWGWFSTNDHAKIVITCKDPDFSKTRLTAEKEGEGVLQQISKGISTEYKGGNLTLDDLKEVCEFMYKQSREKK